MTTSGTHPALRLPGWTQYVTLGAISLITVFITGVLQFSSGEIYPRFFGGLNPLLTFLVIIGLGILSLKYLDSHSGLALFEGTMKGFWFSTGLALIFGIIVITADFLIIFPADTHILFPISIPFYFTIGLFAELLFHVLPITLAMVTFGLVFKVSSQRLCLILSLITASLFEPVFQVVFMFDGHYHPLSIIFVGIHLFLINISQMVIFKRFDFASMLLFRWVYYLIWHVVWGYLRLEILF